MSNKHVFEGLKGWPNHLLAYGVIALTGSVCFLIAYKASSEWLMAAVLVCFTAATITVMAKIFNSK